MSCSSVCHVVFAIRAVTSYPSGQLWTTWTSGSQWVVDRGHGNSPELLLTLTWTEGRRHSKLYLGPLLGRFRSTVALSLPEPAGVTPGHVRSAPAGRVSAVPGKPRPQQYAVITFSQSVLFYAR